MPSRSRPFYFTVKSKTGEKIPVAVNGEPTRIDAPGFSGLCHIIHDTGSETGSARVEPSQKRGLIVQMQGKFAEAATLGEENSSNIWLGGTLGAALNLGWVMRNVVSLGSKFANKKTGGRFYIDLGNDHAPCQMGFHLRALFRVLATSEGEEAPKLGSPELDAIPYGGPGLLEVDTSKTYTLYWKIPYLDLCTWELLKVPAISPLPLENVLGDLSTTRLFMYDLGKCSAHHPDYEQSLLLEATFERGAEGDEFYDPVAAVHPPTVLDAPPGTPKKEPGLPHDDSMSIVDSLQELAEDLSEDSLELNNLFARALQELPLWQGFDSLNGLNFRVPFYIEAIGRFRKQEVRSWYVLRAESADGGFYWQARDAEELAALCRPKRRLSRFLRGAAPRKYHCCDVRTLEQFRLIVTSHLAEDSKMRSAVLQAANAPPDSPQSPSRLMQPPPRFLEPDGTMCGIAFAQAAQGLKGAKREALVGAIHFEGRICEELLRLSSDNFIRCFSPYDCDQPRVLIHAGEITRVEALSQKFLDRFHLFEVQTDLRAYVFCCAHAPDRDEWVAALREAAQAASVSRASGPAGPMSPNSIYGVASAKKAAGRSRNSRGSDVIPNRHGPFLDATGAGRWPNIRYVLNDRLLTSAAPHPLSADAAAHLLELALALGSEPSHTSLAAFLDSTCMLKAVRFNLWSQAELKAFWCNVYHCLLLHGLLVLNTPDSEEKLAIFRRRASYLVGLRPVSLADIETEIFHVPQESAAPPEVESVGKGGCCGFLGGKAARAPTKTSALADTAKQVDQTAAASVELSQKSRVAVECENSSGLATEPVNACMYLDAAETWEAPSMDPRVELILSEGAGSCSIPVLRASSLDRQLDDAASLFVQAQVQTESNGGVVRAVTLPGKCRALKRHFKNERDLLFASGNLAWHVGQCLEPPSSQFLLPRLLPILQHQQEQPA
ncbi:unnamed protein product [Symbiodinium necroappetens]|uniref:PH domain-containing protein n=1 Tax=Symbiodinium necroappetens TaxID=1628268 RepID=A0A812KW43_9DINO|nr:unnamed protein product [Symbiodinium necroappetens]